MRLLLIIIFCMGAYLGLSAQTNMFPTDGNVGIGTLNPLNKLEVAGGITTSGNSTIDGIDFTLENTYYRQLKATGYNLLLANGSGTANFLLPYSSDEYAHFNNLGLVIDKNVGIGLNNPYNLSGIHVKSLNTSAWTILAEANTSHKVIGIGHTGNEGVIAVGYLEDSGYSPLQFWTSNIPRLTITTDGNLGIGTTTPNEKLSVNGKIRTQEIKVENANWPDYVFGDDYKLPTLQEIEQHIKEEGHLEGIPSAEEVKANGIDLGEMNAKLLQKIEELTLHLIELKKVNETMNERILKLER